MSSKRTVGFASLLLAATLVLAGCGGAKKSTSPPSTSAGSSSTSTSTTTHPNAVVMALPPKTGIDWYFPMLTQATCNTYNSWVSQSLLYMPLIHISPQDTIDYSRSLAQSITPSQNGQDYTIDLNPKWHWSNGDPVTASDLKFYWDLVMQVAQSAQKATKAKQKPVISSCWTGVGGYPTLWQSMTVVSPTEVKIHLSKAVNPLWFEYNGLGQLVPIPKKVWDKYPNSWSEELAYVASVGAKPTSSVYKVVDGPFAIQSVQPKQSYTFVPNANYDGHKASIQKFVLQYETSDTAEYAALKTGQIQYGYLPATDYPSGEVKGYKEWNSYTFSLYFTYLNQHSNAPGGLGPVFQQLYMRQALQMTLDQPTVIKNLWNGLGEPQYTVIPNTPRTQFYDPNLASAPYPFNLQKAESLLTSHGWKMENGVMTKGKLKLDIQLYYPSGNQAEKHTIEYWQSNLAKIGIKATLSAEPFGNFVHTVALDPTKWNIGAGSGWGYQPDYFPSGDGLFTSGGFANFGGFSDPQLNKLITATTQPNTTSGTVKAMQQYEEYMAKNLPVLWNFNPANANELADYVSGPEKYQNVITYSISPQFWTVNTGK